MSSLAFNPTRAFSRRENIGYSEGGFTLIEILITVVIIGILAAIAIPVFINARNAAREANVLSDFSGVMIKVSNKYYEPGFNKDTPITAALLGSKAPQVQGTTIWKVHNSTEAGYCIVLYNTDSKEFNSPSRAIIQGSNPTACQSYNVTGTYFDTFGV